MTRAARVVAAARGAVGARFRLHGREAASGLDCVGLAALALRGGGWEGAVPSGYALRGTDRAASARLAGQGLVAGTGEGAGELRLFAAGPGQWHLGIGTEGGLIHADAALRRVVERPGPAPWPMIAAWRLPERGEA